MDRLGDMDEPDAALILIRAHAIAGTILPEQGRYPEAEVRLRKALAEVESQLGPDHEEAATACNNLGTLFKYTGNIQEAETLYRRALTILTRQFGEDGPELASLYHNMGGLEHAGARFAEGEPYACKAPTSGGRLLGKIIPKP